MKRGPYRLETGGLIDRNKPIEFSFDGRLLAGFEGDSLASALLASGVRTVARSFKFHRPRGVFSAGIEEPNALVQLHSGARAIPSARATVVPLARGLEAYTQSGWPNVSCDALRVLDVFAPLFAAGFYNKTFMWPSWHVYEPVIRKLAGLGRSPVEPDPDRYETHNAHCDVLIVGAGVAGLQAAIAAANAGERVILVDQDTQPGGQSRWDRSVVEGVPAAQWLAATLDQLQRAPDVKVMPGTMAVGCYDHNVTTLVESPTARGGAARERYWIVRTQRLVLATGAIEQPLVFCNNDRPGVMLAGAARRYLACQAVAPGRHIVIATNNDSAYSLAQELHQAGIAPVAIVDSRAQPPAARIADMRARSIPLHAGSIPVDTRGFGSLSSVDIGQWVAADAVGAVHRITCDALLVSGGWNPALHLFAQTGGKLRYCEQSRALKPVNVGPGIDIVGSAAPVADSQDIGPRISPHGSTSRQWVDLLHDVTVADLELAVRENFTSIEHVKRLTTVGMAADQGKTSGPASIEIVARLRKCRPADLGSTTLRPPLMPVTLGAIAGRQLGERFAPSRTTPLQSWHAANGALIEHYGQWQRPTVFIRAGETRTAATGREARTVRTAVGLFDASPLGKIEIRGPDAGEFLDRFYINNLATLQDRRIRYGLMLRESGVIYDDGTIVRLAQDRLLITTTSGNANGVAAWLDEWRQCEWPELRVAVVPVTDQWGTITLSGPQARTVLQRLRPDCDLSNEAFPHFGFREANLLGVQTRICRVSFSGELTYEINTPPDALAEIWEALLQEGREFGIAPYGVDAVMLLRLEKGYLHVGSDTDGTTVPDDVGWGKAAAAKRRDFIGKRSLELPENRRADRLQLVGLTGHEVAIPVGSHLRLTDSREVTDGWVTSAGMSVTDGRPIALARLRSGRAHLNASVRVYDRGHTIATTRVVEPIFYDTAGECMNA